MDMQYEAGQLVGADYRIQRLLGQGGFGQVYLARHVHLDREVAIKVVRRQGGHALPDIVQRFEREVNLARKLEHPNIVRLYDHGHLDDGAMFMAMEYVRGEEIEAVLRREGRLKLARATHIVQQILDGLSEAHSAGIVHRDLKPSNVMLSRSGLREDVVKILDFGIAKAFDGTYADLTAQNLAEGVGFGTPQYMAPEQILGYDIGPHTDLYATGLLFVEFVTGQAPMLDVEPTRTIQRQLQEEVPLPEWLRHSPVGGVLLKALTKDYRARYQSAAEMYQAIERAAGSRQSALADFVTPGDAIAGQAFFSRGDFPPVLGEGDGATDVVSGEPTIIVESGPSLPGRGEGPPTEVVGPLTGDVAGTNRLRPIRPQVAHAQKTVASAPTIPTMVSPYSRIGVGNIGSSSGSHRAASPTGPVMVAAPVPRALLVLAGLVVAIFVALLILVVLS